MSNKPIVDMIETIEHFAQTQPSYPVYNVLGQEHTYGDLEADSVVWLQLLINWIYQRSLRWSFLEAKNMKCWQLL